MPAEKKRIMLELSERQSNIIFCLLQCTVNHAMSDTIGEIMESAEHFAVASAMLREELYDDPAYMDLLNQDPEFLTIIQAIHKPFCGHQDVDHETRS